MKHKIPYQPVHIESGIPGLKLVLYGNGEARLYFDEYVKGTFAFFDLQNLQCPGPNNRKIRKTIRTWIMLREIQAKMKVVAE